ncbi:MAG: 23S rRNA (guanosine(2251)-2'-O)-methyltransferase RlmB [Cyanobacteriota bacterium]
MTNDFVYGKNSVEALLKTSERPINKLFVLNNSKNDKKIGFLLKLAKDKHIPVSVISKDKLISILKDSNVNHQGIIASISPVEYADFEDTLNKLKAKETFPLIVILDGVEDPQNLGAIVRSSEVLGVDAVIIPERRSAAVTSIVAKVSSGAIEFIPIIQVTNIVKTIEKLKQLNFWVVGSEYTPESQDVYNVDFNMACAIVMGSEGKGLSRLVKESCDILIKIPQFGKTNSLNVASALSIVLYEIIRQRKL